MAGKSLIHRYLDPGETLGELLFGLIMVLTFTMAARFFTAKEELDAHELVIGAIGCNIAWGVIDAVLFVLGSLFHRSRRARFLRELQSAGSETEALAIVQEEFELGSDFQAVRPQDAARLHRSILSAAAHAGPRTGLRWEDLAAAFVVFFLVSATALPGVIPFMLLGNSYLALRLSNILLVGLLFLVGYRWARYTDSNPWRIGLSLTALGLSLVIVAIALGG
jgi:hypothetical protein